MEIFGDGALTYLCFLIAVIENMLNIFQEETSLFNPQLVIQRDAQREIQSYNIIKSCIVSICT